ncbi:MAG: tRNA uridine-5-carboxymethylaminomethyl(34) synthesis GTPase MnmE [Hydrogenophilus sp.]|nr:tRNA uridine-5-carboxymethylaminomethyl(34) synthesis GTPase MnmE [Hydrogenophilus sp.]
MVSRETGTPEATGAATGARGETIAAVATPPGRGAIAIVRISGNSAAAIGAALIGRRDLLPARRAVRAWARAADGALLDDGLLLYFPAPHSFTGEEVVEFHGHGGPAAMRGVLERVLELGARLARPGEFTERAFLNGKLDLAQAEAIADLIEAETTAAARAAARGLSGEFSRAVAAMSASLTELRVWVEAAIDFPEEGIDFVEAGDVAERLAALAEELQRWQIAGRQGLLLREGVRVAIVGAPNVGKSSLLNALVGEERAIVSEWPGTTRDLVRERVEVEGMPVWLLDTAGLRPSTDRVEQIGVERARAARADAEIVLWVRAPDVADEAVAAEILSSLQEGQRLIEVWNKADRFPPPPGEERLWIAAQTGQGIAQLKAAIAEAAGRTPGEAVWLARKRHLLALAEAEEAARQASTWGKAGAWELMAEELRAADAALGTIVGRTDPETLLAEIFSRFCIGK